MIANTSAIGGYAQRNADEVPAISKMPRRQLATVKQAIASAHAWRVRRGAGRTFMRCPTRAGSAPPMSGMANMNVMKGL